LKVIGLIVANFGLSFRDIVRMHMISERPL
jgi:hypothetical protein